MKILLAPHNDDEALFAAFTIMREKPLVIVVTDGYIQLDRGVGPHERRYETIDAMRILSAPVVFLGIPDTGLTPEVLKARLAGLDPELVYAPAVYPNGNKGHNVVGSVAMELWPNKVKLYHTYELNRLYIDRDNAILPSLSELETKNRALDAYKSQLRLNKPHFDAVRGLPEHIS